MVKTISVAAACESPEKKNNFGSIKAFKANRMMERMNTSNASNNSMLSNSPNKEEGLMFWLMFLSTSGHAMWY